MDGALTREALENAFKNSQKLAEIFNTDQGSQFTAPEWVEKLEGLGIKVSMDGKGRWMDNVFIERLWRTLKYEDVYLKEYRTLCDLRQGLREIEPRRKPTEKIAKRRRRPKPHEKKPRKPPPPLRASDFCLLRCGPRRPLRYAPRPAGPCATETKIGDQSPKEIELKAHPL
jgi:transposase InsO family protein